MVGLESSGFGIRWGHGLTYSNRLTVQNRGINGNSWAMVDCPYLVRSNGGETLCLVRGFYTALWFDEVGSAWVPRFGVHDRLEHQSGEYVHTDARGIRTRFYDFATSEGPQGQLKGFEDAFGHTGVAEYDTLQRLETFELSGPGGASNQYEYDYYETGEVAGRLEWVTLWVNGAEVRRNEFEYYTSSDADGNSGDLKRMAIQQRVGASWDNLEHYYFRYYTLGEANGFRWGLKYVVGPGAYAAMEADSIDPLSATDAVLAGYADNYFEYDAQKRVVLEEVSGGSRTYQFERSVSAFSPGPSEFNQWVTKTVETLPDGNRNIVFANRAGQVMLKVFASADESEQWCTYNRYDDHCRVVMRAEPSAFKKVAGAYYDESKADLLDYNATNGQFKYLNNDSGLIHLTEYYPDVSPPTEGAPGYLKSRQVKKGVQGTAIKIRDWEYTSRTAQGQTIYPVRKEICYPSASNQLLQIECTLYSYTWHTDTLQMLTRTTTLPAVAASEHGSGGTDTRVEEFDGYGRVIELQDERGIVTGHSYDLATGALVQRVDDVGGLDLVTDYEHDDLGRITQELEPVHQVDLVTPSVRRAK